MWLCAYHTSSGPKVIAGYFMGVVTKMEGTARIIREDLGTENCTVGNIQCSLRQDANDGFAGDRSFLYGRSTGNQRIEQWWSQFRREWTQFWMELFQQMVDDGQFDGTFIDRNLIQFCLMRQIQVCKGLYVLYYK